MKRGRRPSAYALVQGGSLDVVEAPEDITIVSSEPGHRSLVELISDRPIVDPAEDRLGFAAYATALAEVIDNPATATPLTVSIDAPWGAGKTSLAHLVEYNLRRWPKLRGDPPHIICWFNAWMHSDAPKLGPALAAAVSKTVARERPTWARFARPLPSVMLSPAEQWRRRLVLAAVAALAAAAALFAPGLPSPFDLGSTSIGSPTRARLTFGVSILGALPAIVALWSRAFSVAQAAAAFVDDPKSQAATGSMADVAEQFGKLVRSATRGRRRVVIFVDDLERCDQERAVEICQTAALLLAQPEVVTVLIGDLSALRTHARNRFSGASNAEEDYGRSYFEKIVQVEFSLPRLDRYSSSAILSDPVDSSQLRQVCAGEQSAPRGTAGRGWPPWKDRFFATVATPKRYLGFLAINFAVFSVLSVVLTAFDPNRGTTSDSGSWVSVVLGLALLVQFVLLAPGFVYMVVRRVKAVRIRSATADIDRTISSLVEPVRASPWTVEETVEKAADALVSEVSTTKASTDLLAQRARRILVDQLVGHVSTQMVRFLPRLPRSIKRLANRQRLVVAVAVSRDMIGGSPPLNGDHLAKWVLLLERWPDLAAAIMREPLLGGPVGVVNRRRDPQRHTRSRIRSRGTRGVLA
jgi:hypothetical protein